MPRRPLSWSGLRSFVQIPRRDVGKIRRKSEEASFAPVACFGCPQAAKVGGLACGGIESPWPLLDLARTPGPSVEDAIALLDPSLLPRSRRQNCPPPAPPPTAKIFGEGSLRKRAERGESEGGRPPRAAIVGSAHTSDEGEGRHGVPREELLRDLVQHERCARGKDGTAIRQALDGHRGEHGQDDHTTKAPRTGARQDGNSRRGLGPADPSVLETSVSRCGPRARRARYRCARRPAGTHQRPSESQGGEFETRTPWTRARRPPCSSRAS